MPESSSRDNRQSHLLGDLPPQGRSHSAVSADPQTAHPQLCLLWMCSPSSQTSTTGWERSVVTPGAVAGEDA